MLKHKLCLRLNKLMICLFTILLFNVTCKKHDDSNIEEDVYVSGDISFDGITRAVYWKNQTQVFLPLPKSNDVQNSYAKAIFISGHDIYLAGSVWFHDIQKAVYWKNNEIFILGDGWATDIVVKDNDVYVSGCYYDYAQGDHNPNKIAAYWKNGVVTKLEHPLAQTCYGSTFSVAKSIVVSGSDVYIAGGGAINCNADIAMFWKNNIVSYLDDCAATTGQYCNSSMVSDLVLQGDDVYMTGYISYSKAPGATEAIKGPVYWKNNTSFQITNTYSYNYSLAIAVKDSTIYTVGMYGGKVFNKDGSSYIMGIDLYGIETNITGITFGQKDIYLCGHKTDRSNYGIVSYWKNYRQTILAPIGEATGIVVVKRK